MNSKVECDFVAHVKWKKRPTGSGSLWITSTDRSPFHSWFNIGSETYFNLFNLNFQAKKNAAVINTQVQDLHGYCVIPVDMTSRDAFVVLPVGGEFHPNG